MALRAALLAAALMCAVQPSTVALACGDGEAPTSCDDPSPNGFASWMLGRVGRALQADPAKALTEFTTGANGFRTADTYVFCVGPDGVMSAHPNPILKGHDVRDLHDKTGNHFIQTMLDTAKPGQIAVIHYLFPKPGSTIEEPKTTYYTKAGDQMCAVGVYDTDQAAPSAATPDGRVALLRQKLDEKIPSPVRADWIAFLEALNAQGDAKAAAIAQARRDIRAATAALDSTGLKPAGTE
ncbi:cache domain-containing protein [Methylobacterium sp. J-048]|uniref:cache domain-containing protein n=1 Tax=Methylobacterium sp. J-048 TaxID=2836635 RepID=UPI001FBB6AFB|nr:cache domain-containing protein [Methylobacterium sp. J-048]MCJ2057454.1 cache domain-containing protein [Methylobacterium sp. J-048]